MTTLFRFGSWTCDTRRVCALIASPLLLASGAFAESSRLVAEVTLSGTWEDSAYYEVETRNSNFLGSNPFQFNDEGPNGALVEALGTRERPAIDPWPYPDIDPIVQPTQTVIGRSLAADNRLEIIADAVDEDDIEGFARILHLTPTVDQTIEVTIDFDLNSTGGVFWAGLRMTNELSAPSENLLPIEARLLGFGLFNAGSDQGTLTVPVAVQAGESYTFEAAYDVFPSFIPEPTAAGLLGGMVLILSNLRRGPRIQRLSNIGTVPG